MSRNYYDESIRNKLLEMKLLKKSMTLVDLGAGDGYLARGVAKAVRKVIAVDISGQMLKELQKKARVNGIKNIEPLESDGQDLSLAQESVDIVCANMYLHHIQEPLLAVREMHRILKPGGRVFLADFSKHSNTELKEKMRDVWAGFSAEELEQWFVKTGFVDIKIEILDSPEVERHPRGERILVLTAARSRK